MINEYRPFAQQFIQENVVSLASSSRKSITHSTYSERRPNSVLPYGSEKAASSVASGGSVIVPEGGDATHLTPQQLGVMECKQTNGSTWNEKNLAWDKIAMEFNANSPSKINRTKESLKKCYENKKAEVRIAASNRQGLQATGGGVFTPKTDPWFGSEKLRFASDRRRPKVVQPIHTNFLSKQYSEVATLKRDYLKHELQTSINKELREEEEFKLRKRSLELDIQIKELQLKRLKTNSIQFSM
ncbi:hypothetical protein FQR65_LT02263 [Abscondita terminalis]|nr:hypothetical protein FQR65_LT02263 [Abscondita terminalis]